MRTPFYVCALVAAGLCVLIELGSSLLPTAEPDLARLVQQSQQISMEENGEELDSDQVSKIEEMAGGPPGSAIPYLALVDGLLLFVVLLYGLAFLISDAVHGRVRGLVSLIVSVLLLLGSLTLIFVELTLLLIKVGLFLAAPFGTIAYLALYGSFDRGGASVVLSLLMILKIVFCILLVLAQQRFLKIKSLVLLTLTSLLATFIIGFLHGFVPIFLVSITDSLAALICGILALIWSIFFLIPSIVGTVKAIKR